MPETIISTFTRLNPQFLVTMTHAVSSTSSLQSISSDPSQASVNTITHFNATSSQSHSLLLVQDSDQLQVLLPIESSPTSSIVAFNASEINASHIHPMQTRLRYGIIPRQYYSAYVSNTSMPTSSIKCPSEFASLLIN